MNYDYGYFYSNIRKHGINKIKLVYNRFQQTEKLLWYYL